MKILFPEKGEVSRMSCLKRSDDLSSSLPRRFSDVMKLIHFNFSPNGFFRLTHCIHSRNSFHQRKHSNRTPPGRSFNYVYFALERILNFPRCVARSDARKTTLMRASALRLIESLHLLLTSSSLRSSCERRKYCVAMNSIKVHWNAWFVSVGN